MKLNDLYENRWAIDQNADAAYGWVRGAMRRSSHKLVWINIADAFHHTTKGFEMALDDPSGGSNAIGNRIAKAHAFWDNGGYMNPSDITVHPGGRIDWGDGRHRMVVAHQRGEQYAPVLMDNESFHNLKNSSIDWNTSKPD